MGTHLDPGRLGGTLCFPSKSMGSDPQTGTFWSGAECQASAGPLPSPRRHSSQGGCSLCQDRGPQPPPVPPSPRRAVCLGLFCWRTPSQHSRPAGRESSIDHDGSLSPESWLWGGSHLTVGGGERQGGTGPGHLGRVERSRGSPRRRKREGKQAEARKTAASQQPCLIRVCCRPGRIRGECGNVKGGWEEPGDLLPAPQWRPWSRLAWHQTASAPQISLKWGSEL